MYVMTKGERVVINLIGLAKTKGREGCLQVSVIIRWTTRSVTSCWLGIIGSITEKIALANNTVTTKSCGNGGRFERGKYNLLLLLPFDQLKHVNNLFIGGLFG